MLRQVKRLESACEGTELAVRVEFVLSCEFCVLSLECWEITIEKGR